MSNRADDLKMLDELLARDLRDDEREAFTDMLVNLNEHYEQLTDKQRTWVKSRYEDFVPLYENAWSAGTVPKGRDVPTPEVLKSENLPKRPPQRCGFCGRAGCNAECL